MAQGSNRRFGYEEENADLEELCPLTLPEISEGLFGPMKSKAMTNVSDVDSDCIEATLSAIRALCSEVGLPDLVEQMQMHELAVGGAAVVIIEDVIRLKVSATLSERNKNMADALQKVRGGGEYVAQDDWLYGPILIVCTAFSGGLGVVLILAELLQAMAPEAHQTITGSARRLYRYFKGISLTAAVAPTGLNDNVPSVATPLSSSGLQEEAAVVEEQRAPSVTSARVKAVPNLDGEVSDCPPMRWEFNSDQAHIDACRVFNSRLEL